VLESSPVISHRLQCSDDELLQWVRGISCGGCEQLREPPVCPALKLVIVLIVGEAAEMPDR
jgi:hypothetical protein